MSDLKKMTVPLVDLKANYQSIKAEVDAAIHEVLDSAYYVGGPQIKKFEAEFAQYEEAKECIGLNSGTDALILTWKALGIGEGDEVITQANTFVATVLGISQSGATPVLVDIDPETMMMDVTKIEAKINSKTKAICPVHLYGLGADMDAITAIAKKHNLLIVEDTAQAHGARFNGKRLGTFGVAGCFSFYPGKNLGAYGDGGGVVTNDPKLAESLRLWRNYGQRIKYHHDLPGTNSRLDSIQAAVLSVRLSHLDKWNVRRREVAKEYTEKLAGVGDLKLPVVPKGVEPVWHLYVIRTEKRDELLKHCQERGVMSQIHYPIPIHELGAYKHLAHQAPELPVATKSAKQIVSLPIHPDLTPEQVQYVVDTVKAFFA